MTSHQIYVENTLTHKAAKIIAHILISAKGIQTPVTVLVLTPSIEYTVLIE